MKKINKHFLLKEKKLKRNSMRLKKKINLLQASEPN